MLTFAAICACTLWWNPLLQRPGIDSVQAGSAGIEHQAAQIALLAFRVTVAGAASTREAFILPSRVSLSMDQAANRLAIMRKPVRCTGALEGAVLAIACQSLEETEALEHYQRAARHISVWGAEVKKRCPGPVGEASLLLRKKGTSITVRFSALAAWLRDYAMDFSLGGVTARPPRGVCMIIEVGPPGTIKIEKGPAGPLRS